MVNNAMTKRVDWLWMEVAGPGGICVHILQLIRAKFLLEYPGFIFLKWL